MKKIILSLNLILIIISTNPDLMALEKHGVWVVYKPVDIINSICIVYQKIIISTEAGMLYYDVKENKWNYPFTRVDGLPIDRVNLAILDDTFNEFLIFTKLGNVVLRENVWGVKEINGLEGKEITNVAIDPFHIYVRWVEGSDTLWAKSVRGTNFFVEQTQGEPPTQLIWQPPLGRMDPPPFYTGSEYLTLEVMS